MNNNTTRKTQQLTGMAIFSAIIVVLTIFCTFIKFGPVSITLALAPIIIGAAVYGAGAGAILGFVFSLVVLLTGIFGWDGGFIMYLMSLSPVGLLVTIFLKGTAAGFLSGVLYRVISRKNEKTAVLCAGIACPIVNTGLFVACMFLFFMDALQGMAGGRDLVAYIIFGLCGINFVIELVVNIALSSVITYIIKLRKKSGRAY